MILLFQPFLIIFYLWEDLRKTLSILLLAVFAFNAVGYYSIYLIAKYHHDRAFSARLDLDEYAGSESIIVKIPFSLPAQPNFNGYERVNSEFVCNGEVYKMIKQKVVRDTLYVVMVKDRQQESMRQALAQFTEGQHSSKSESRSSVIDTFSKDYISGRCQIIHQATGWSQPLVFATRETAWSTIPVSLQTPPPKVEAV